MGAVENSLPVVDSLTSEERSESEQSEIRAGSDRYGIDSCGGVDLRPACGIDYLAAQTGRAGHVGRSRNPGGCPAAAQ